MHRSAGAVSKLLRSNIDAAQRDLRCRHDSQDSTAHGMELGNYHMPTGKASHFNTRVPVPLKIICERLSTFHIRW